MANEPKVEIDAEQAASAKIAPHHRHSWWLIGGVLAGIAIIALVCGMTWGMARRASLADIRFDDSMMMGHHRLDDRSGRGSIRGSGGIMGDNLASDSTRVTGVVTAIDGTTLTVAGGGVTKKVTTNDSTSYFGAAQPVKVNDTVMITGTTSGDTFAAGRIVIQRQ